MISYDSRRWVPIVMSLQGTVVPRVALKALSLGVIAAGIMLLRGKGLELKVDALPHNLIGVALGMLLVFRNNASYDRYWEGRKCWGAIVNTSRNLARAVSGYTASAQEVPRLLTAYVLSLKQHLRSETDYSEVQDLVTPEQYQQITATKNVPMAISVLLTRWLAGAVQSGMLPQSMVRSIEVYVSDLLNNQGACERILRTPMPFGYVAHIRQLLSVYLLTLPVVLVDKLGWWAVPAGILIAFGLIGIEEIGVEIEDPFGTDPNDLPIETFCQTIQRDTTAAQELVARL